MRVCLQLQTAGFGRQLVWRVRPGQHPTRRKNILWEQPAEGPDALTRDQAILAARAWATAQGHRLIVNEAWLEPPP